MSQPQPKSLTHYRTLSVELGCAAALKEASKDVDHLSDQLGRRLDLLSVLRVSQIAGGFVLGVLVCWAMACAAIGGEAEKDWPALKTSIIYSGDVSKECGKYALMPLACAEIDFEKKTCVIYTSVNWAWVLIHEQEHCAGKDHENETSLRDAWNKYKGR